MRSIVERYLEISGEVKFLILSELFLHIINAAFFLILLIYMDKMGYPDHEAAGFISYRFLGVIAFSLPLGLYIKGRKLRPLILASGIAVPVFSILIVYAIQFHHNTLLHAALFFWGVAFNLITVSSLPFILRNVNQETLSEAISLSYATGSLGTIIAGALIFVLSNFAPAVFDEKLILYLISFGGFVAFFFAMKISKNENTPAITSRRTDLTDFDWLLIIKALIPTLIIATGAGLTIPFISLFFYKIHGLDYNRFFSYRFAFRNFCFHRSRCSTAC
jgi:fucose permease